MRPSTAPQTEATPYPGSLPGSSLGWRSVTFMASAVALLLVGPAAWASCAASVSATVLAGDHVQITGGASGPCGKSAMNLYIDGHKVGEGSSDDPSFTGFFNLTDCFAPGAHTVDLYAYCNTGDDSSCPEDGHVPHAASTGFSIPDPEVTVSVNSATVDDYNVLHIVAGYSIPLESHGRSVTVYENGLQLQGAAGVTSQTGSVPFDIDLSCRAPGTYDFGVSAAGCNQIDYKPVPAGPRYNVMAKLNVKPDGGSSYNAEIKYSLTGVTDPNLRSLSLQKLPLNKSGGSPVLLANFTSLGLSGTVSHSVTPTEEEQLLYAVGGVCPAKDDSVAHVPSCCPSVGDPVSLQKGNMRYSDSEPLPSAGFGPLQRVYDSNNTETGLFGYGWSSLLDSWVRFYTTVGSTGVAVIGTEENDRVVFSNVTGAWRQIWPVQDNVRSTFSYSSGVAVWTDLAAKKVWTFGTGGALASVRSLIDGREWTITRDGSGYPTAVSDSWGSVVWTVSVDATSHLVTSVGVQGRTDLTWTYQYGTGHDLTSVLAPDSAT
ncbi:MAG: repeat protein, partial [Acidobacteria bacterium]|nr:repeat protein [Acidobacteriota bacterium]